MSPGGSTDIFRRATPSTPMSQKMCLSPRALPPFRRLHEDKKENSAYGCLFPKMGSVAAHLRGIRPTLTTKKDTLMLRRNSNIILFLLNFLYNYTMYFSLLCTHTDTYIKRILNNAHIYGYVFIRNQTDPD